ncbi:putative membrane protein (DUF2053) family protein [Theileria parva strain Muguga]|uniref:putative membrane protein (DUF2053) family protein n=1 Tax=Theileria parva strain Muguga TaxID=333668 RepID=UPI001C618654|nr:putative membrane protein (DUF2053) family protein [Theileria parva strain Muguga]EAN30836.2 putative membrane protein (DUF2053) family protein [Theileria parva strain Muguga]
MRVLQIISGFAMLTFPYFLLHTTFGLKENFNNGRIFRSTMFYSLLSLICKILLMATGIPELLAKFLLPEKLVLALLDTVSLVGMKFALTSKTSMSAKSDHRVTCVGLSWSLVNSLGNSLVIIWKLIKSSEYSLRFFYFCLNSNLSVVGFLCNSCLVQMYLKFKQTPKQLYYLIASYIFLFPILSTYAYDELVLSRWNVLVFVLQVVLGIPFAYTVKHFYTNKFKSPK